MSAWLHVSLSGFDGSITTPRNATSEGMGNSRETCRCQNSRETYRNDEKRKHTEIQGKHREMPRNIEKCLWKSEKFPPLKWTNLAPVGRCRAGHRGSHHLSLVGPREVPKSVFWGLESSWWFFKDVFFSLNIWDSTIQPFQRFNHGL